MNFRTRRRPDDIEINFVPLIDVLVVLLIFLMVTTSFSRLGQLKVDLPQAAAGATAPTDNTIDLAISADGQYAVDALVIGADDTAGLTAALRKAAIGHDDPVLVMSVDRKTPHERVIAAMTAAREAGLDSLTFTVDTAAQRHE
ncbi:ExbD/TolR family protein [Immundisolibacter sp.]|uniref:ExbD/TolR family protein n=1 Tax=Immundisolibacter sp. TaxID=1934948 RepID=UPI003564F43C